MRAILTFVAAAALSACAGGAPVGETVLVPSARFGGAQGEADLVVRAFVEDAGGTRHEVRGAACEVTSIFYEAQVSSPGRVVLPSFGAQSPTLRVTCRAGERRGAAEQAVLTRWVGRPAAWRGWDRDHPFGGPYAYGPWGWGGWDGPSYPVFFYPDVNVILR